MSNYQGRSKALKRRFNGDDEDGSSKRTRVERAPENPSNNNTTNSAKPPIRNLAANRLAALRQTIKKTVSAVPGETDAITVTKVQGSKNIKVRVDSAVPSETKTVKVTRVEGSKNIKVRVDSHGRNTSSNIICNVEDSKPHGKCFDRKLKYRIPKTVNTQVNLSNKSSSLNEVKQPNISSSSIVSAAQHIKNSYSEGKYKEVPSSSLCPTKNSSINDRLKRARQKSPHKDETDDDDTIIVIDNSFDSVLNKYVTKDLLNKSEGSVRNKVDQMQSSRRSTNDSRHSLSKSFIVVSEATNSDERCSTQSASNHRLNTFNSSSNSISYSSISSRTLTPSSNESSTSYSSISSRTLTPSSNKRSPEVSQKTSNTSKVLRVPLKRTIFNGTQVSPEKRRENNVCKAKGASTGIRRDFGTQKSRETLKDNIFSTKHQGTFNGDVSETRKHFGSEISCKMFKREAPIKEDIFSTKLQRAFGSQISPEATKKDNIFSTTFQGTSNKEDTFKKGAPIKRDNNIFSKEVTDTRSDFGAQISSQIFKKLSPIRKDDELCTNNVSSPELFQNVPLTPRSPITKVQYINIFKPDSNKGKFENRAKSSLADRLTRIKNQTSATTAKNLTRTIVNQNATEPVSINAMDAESLQKNPSQEVVTKDDPLNWLQSTAIPKAAMIENWIDPRPSISDQTISDSMLVNVNDDTLYNKSELMTEQQEDVSMEWDSYPEPQEIKLPSENATSRNDQRENIICLVADTNVFMHDLPRLRDLVNIRDIGNQKIKIYVPWMVLQELDHLKETRASSSRTPAFTAQKFINKQLEQPDPKIIGQSVHDVSEQRNIGKSPDDKILSCCLQAGTKFQSVILLSNDINLRNKALTNNVKTYAPKEVLGKLKGTKSLKIKVRLQNLLSQIIYQSCQEAYGDVCSRMDMLQDCPWSFAGCLKRFKRYWNAVFKQLLLKQCLKVIEELITFTEKGDIDDSDPKSLKKFRDKVKEFLFYLQDIDQYREAIKRVRDEIDSIVEAPSALCDL